MRHNIPLKRPQTLSVAIPASLVSDVPHLREKTMKIGLIGRALAIFRVDEVIVYPDISMQRQFRDIDLITTILAYLETPQYLRKHLFKIRPELRYSGILPPLRTPHHPLCNHEKDLTVGEFREGVIISRPKNGVLVDIGVERPALVVGENISEKTRVTVKVIEKGRQLKAQLAKAEDIQEYWGYKVTVSNKPLGHMLKERHFDLVIATSRLGEPFMKVAEKICQKWKESETICIAFGAPMKGLYEIVKTENLNLSDLADFIVNVVPNQATETIRTEEALYATLAVLNIVTP
ncbi:MAG: RNA methyltransferase [Candidatus Bathyarchaeia archaeon]|nr:RNA-binding protein [Candidatus Bathyarchaeota archaeon]